MKLAPEEREVIVTYNDADRSWHVFSDSATMRGTVLKLARQVGAEVKRTGQGVEFDCPGDLLRLTAKRRLRLSPEDRDARHLRLRHQPKSLGPAGTKTGPAAGGTE